jgi:hypothetical protein
MAVLSKLLTLSREEIVRLVKSQTPCDEDERNTYLWFRNIFLDQSLELN